MSGVHIALAGLGGPIITIQNQTINGSGASPATAGYTLQSDADILKDEDGSVSDLGDWIVPRAAAGSAWEVSCSAVPGTNLVGSDLADGTWLSLGTSRSWTCQRLTVPGTNVETLTINIRKAATGVIKDTAVITLNATVV